MSKLQDDIDRVRENCRLHRKVGKREWRVKKRTGDSYHSLHVHVDVYHDCRHQTGIIAAVLVLDKNKELLVLKLQMHICDLGCSCERL